jgi:nicotinate-nucleotide adenylyltransferase
MRRIRRASRNMSTAAASRRLTGSGFGTIAARLPPSSGGQAIGLLGGSFNPAHAAHVQISETAIRRLGLARVWWLVTPGNPLKVKDAPPPLAERLVIARRLAGRRPITVTGFEAGLRDRFTVSTLAYLRRRRPDTRFVWVMGADCLAEFHRWRQWREIMSLVPIAVIDRPGWRLKALSSIAAKAYAAARRPEREARGLAAMGPPAWVFLTAPLSDLSSTAIRAARKP